jgi:hypothetical protein
MKRKPKVSESCPNLLRRFRVHTLWRGMSNAEVATKLGISGPIVSSLRRDVTRNSIAPTTATAIRHFLYNLPKRESDKYLVKARERNGVCSAQDGLIRRRMRVVNDTYFREEAASKAAVKKFTKRNVPAFKGVIPGTDTPTRKSAAKATDKDTYQDVVSSVGVSIAALKVACKALIDREAFLTTELHNTTQARVLVQKLGDFK